MTFGSVMFHHFSGGIHPTGQGAITAEEFDKIIAYLKKNYQILNPQEYTHRAVSGRLLENETCITFDDGLKCQLDIASQVLDAHELFAYFFVYSGIFSDQPNRFEIFRDFRNTEFGTMDAFYTAFCLKLEKMYPAEWKKFEDAFPDDHLSEYKFYTANDRRFRYVRDYVLSDVVYGDLMRTMILETQYSEEEATERLWLTKKDVRTLSDHGHTIGLHSHSHSMTFDRLTIEEQKYEYRQNLNVMEAVTGKTIYSMAHPCGLYTGQTLTILSELEIYIGFRCNQHVAYNGNTLELPRIDHADLMDKFR